MRKRSEARKKHLLERLERFKYTAHHQAFRLEHDVKYKIMTQGEGLSWSTITELVNDEKDRLRDLAIDLLREREIFCAIKSQKEESAKKALSDERFNMGKICSLLDLAKNRFNLEKIRFVENGYLFDIERRPENIVYWNVEKLDL